jgi:hypothetical protein
MSVALAGCYARCAVSCVCFLFALCIACCMLDDRQRVLDEVDGVYRMGCGLDRTLCRQNCALSSSPQTSTPYNRYGIFIDSHAALDEGPSWETAPIVHSCLRSSASPSRDRRYCSGWAEEFVLLINSRRTMVSHVIYRAYLHRHKPLLNPEEGSAHARRIENLKPVAVSSLFLFSRQPSFCQEVAYYL